MGISIIDLLLPRETKFFVLLSHLSDHLLTGCTIFRDLLVKIEAMSEEEIKKHVLIIKECEQKSDESKGEIMDALWRTFITPIDREDIHTLAINMERTLDVLNGTSRKIEIFHIRKIPVNACIFANIIVNIAKLQSELVHGLQAKKDVREKVEAMHSLEHQADELYHISLAGLYNDDERYQTVENMKFRELYEHLEAVVDSIDYIGKLIHGIRMKQG
ncbi:MAG: DUF47 family protein [Candidatus Latescibacterota bacterium]